MAMAATCVSSHVLCSAAFAPSTSSSGCSVGNSGIRCAIVSRSHVGGSSSCRSGSSLRTKQLMGRSLRFEQAEGISKSVNTGLVVEAAKRVQTGRSYVLSSTLNIEEGKEEEVAALCKDILVWAEEKKNVKGSGITVFECNVDPFEKNVFHFWERYDSFQIMNDIRASPEHTKFLNDVRPLLTGPIGLAAYEYKDGQIGHMMNPIGPKGEGGLDDATGQSGTKQQSSSIGQGLGQMEEDEDVKSWGLDKLLAKVRGEDREAGWSFKTLFGDIKKGSV
ncbi:hypothetical protein MPTK1_6g10490 [Marchantia polymorpha subsp. ruderalis]|uniref:ABM domain-containing protein n=2 Tax=Marchantia polymorpha TaxID=3197 RepID=A0A176W995_MARPO|nr:hypothetical protein AXG93_4003s1210 [Marchantia polymorpha subsp. ruderalis]PTQ45032.1 hypothetical protein MARPO_0016s0090 [Marchantia polymorpha]BBN14298.1 hypothetical protein Mp_6g10490 [Marchantia polymorpha subsp. ruderalis]|eukprot:PTQ45032.1 hypothetical protein MARPO_0016s0090 [Marchantia polymorpha]